MGTGTETGTMQDEELMELLHAQPRSSASDDFAAGTMRRIARDAGQHRLNRQFAAVAAVVLMVASGAAGHHAWREHQRIETLRAEHRRLEAELQQLKVDAAEYEPVVYVGGDERADYVVNLRGAANGH